MKLLNCLKAATLVAVAGLAACATPGSGPTVVSYDHGALDTLVALGQRQRVLAVPKAGLPDYLAEVAAGLPDAGTLKVPDLAVLRTLAPDLILITGRQGESAEALARIARVREVGLADGDFREALATKVMGLAALYGAEARARDQLDDLWRHVARQREALPAGIRALVITHNGGRYSLRREPVVSELLGLVPPAIPDAVEPVRRGTRVFYPVTAEDLAAMAPEVVLVVDRSAAIGQAPLPRGELERALAAAGAGDIRVGYLDPRLWYLSGAGLVSVKRQVDEVVGILVTSSRNRG
ncbi:hypothetical protein BTO32_03675 [Marinobacter lutaoensis]|jgi:iron complex transport system substrate-binding protein|uniref:Fe/B12 periplasmic-binding domain-containing protein n=1 Tax=Marinobacter lutaoensis TaxID=135739 RepID=A0A1V2DVQ7_9GAMM|nr:ABC transporter substrate-binding protein [Marinobacter lutaoensis]ONF44845.1 hypothetical protein BTO32_03675 [Marinobacter lutaoensis]